MIYDAHTHLNAYKLYKNREEHYNTFVKKGGEGLVTVGMAPTYNERAIEIAEATKNNDVPVKITLGIHPCEIGNTVLTKKDVDTQMELIKKQVDTYKEHVVAIGETGIDAYHGEYTLRKDLQAYAFIKQCELAREVKLPIVIHSRSQFEDTFEIIKQYKDLKVYFHCRGYGSEQIEILSKTLPNFRVGFCGNVTYPKALPLQESFQQARKNDNCNVLFETDAPYLTPQKRRGTTNTPDKVTGIYEFCSETYAIPMQELQETIKESYQKLYY